MCELRVGGVGVDDCEGGGGEVVPVVACYCAGCCENGAAWGGDEGRGEGKEGSGYCCVCGYQRGGGGGCHCVVWFCPLGLLWEARLEEGERSIYPARALEGFIYPMVAINRVSVGCSSLLAHCRYFCLHYSYIRNILRVWRIIGTLYGVI